MQEYGSGASPNVRVTENATQARQGVTGHNVRYVLAWGLGGAVLVLLFTYVVFPFM
jgi:hypothetical protein